MSTLSIALLGGLIGVFIGAALGRYVDPERQQNLEHHANLKKAQEELAAYRQQVKDHFTQTASLMQALADSSKAVRDHLAIDALKLSGLDLRPASEDSHEYNLAKLAAGHNMEAPKDYAQKNKNAVKTLSEEYGLHDDYDDPVKTVRG